MATATTPGKKHLRVALRQGSKITEDRTLKKRVPLTIGQDAKNTFVVPVSDLPTSFTVLELVNDQYALVFKKGMEGQVSQGTEPEVTLEQAISSGKAKARGDVYVLPLTDASKGRIKLGEISLLFQFVTPPPEPPKPELPADVRGSVFSQIDRFFLTVLGVSLLVHFSGGAYCAIHPKIEEAEVALEDLPDRFAKAIMPEVKPPPEKKPEVADKGPDKKDDKKDDKKADTKADKPATSNKPSDAVKAAVASKGLLKILGANAGGGGAFQDLLGGENSGAGSVADALNGASGVGVATSDTLGNNGIKGGGSGSAASIGDLGTQGGGNVALGEKAEVAVKGRMQDSAPEVESGEVDRAKLAAFVRQRKASIQGCYEKELKRNPTLKGKVVVRFNITPSGGTSDIDLEENTLGNEAVGACIKTLIRGWRFPFKPSSEVPVAYPFVFSPAS